MPNDPGSPDRPSRPAPDTGASNPMDGPSVLNDLPQFALEYTVDDRTAPAAVTVFDAGTEAIATHWLTVDAAHAVDLADCA